MSVHKKSVTAGVLFLLFWSMLAAYAYFFPPPKGPPQLAYNPVFFPAILMGLGAVFALIIVGQGLLARRHARNDSAQAHDVKRVTAVVVSTGLYFAAMPIVGFIPSSFVFILVLTTILRYRNWPAVIVVAAAGPAAVWLMFTHGLQAPLPAFGSLL